MSAASLLVILTRLRFSVAASETGIRIAPANKLTEGIRQAIKENKSELLALLRAGSPSATAAATQEVQTPRRQAAPQPIPEPTVSKSIFCPRCRQKGHPDCIECLLATDPGLERGKDGFLYKTSYVGTPFQKGPTPRRDWPRWLA